MYNLMPSQGYVIVEPLKTSEVKTYTGKILADVETSGVDILQYGRVVRFQTGPDDSVKWGTGDIVAYPKLASDKTNFGDPRQVIVEIGHIKAYLEEAPDAQATTD